MNLKLLLTLLISIFYLNGFSQISAIADFSEATEYSDSDLVFVFCTDITDAGELTANDSTQVGGFDFEWYKFNDVTNRFTDILSGFTISNDSTNSTISNLNNGGYKVILTKGSQKQEYVAWVYNNNELSIEIQFHDENDCDYLALLTDPYYHTSQYINTPLVYYDTISGTSTTLQNQMSEYIWTADPDIDSFRSFDGPFTSIGEDATDNDSELPTENTTFSVTVTDRFGCTAEDDIEYTAIETDANFSWTTINDKTEEIIGSGSSDNEIAEPAPLIVRFTNESLNGQDYYWFFGDTLWNDDVDFEETSNFLDEPEHLYRTTVADSGKTYIMRMYSTSNDGCKDSIFFKIKLEPSKIEFPNVFTPNNDNVNDVFFVPEENYQSIKSFKITLFNRVGQVVHEYEGDIRDWEGWDGKVRDSNREAPAGNYFFVVEVTGWDNVDYNNNNFKSTSNSQDSQEGGQESGDSKPKFGIIRLFR
ncbi:gliding motility-associated C-terminal domain-containing protein [Bacteroidota bacterium]